MGGRFDLLAEREREGGRPAPPFSPLVRTCPSIRERARDVFSPIQCRLWREPELLARKDAPLFDVLERFHETSHDLRALVRCTECGERYVFDFHEEIDWDEGADPSYSTYVPVRHDADIAALRDVPAQFGSLEFSPRLQYDTPKGKPVWVLPAAGTA